MALRSTLHCTLCGRDTDFAKYGITPEGAYDPANAPQHEMSLRIDDIGGRGHLVTGRHPVPLATAYGILDALKAAVARVRADIAAAGGELPED